MTLPSIEMTPIAVLQEFAQELGWSLRVDGSTCQVVDVDRDGAHTILATLTTRGGSFPARLVFQKHEVPDIVSRDDKDFEQALNSLQGLEAFRHLAVR